MTCVGMTSARPNRWRLLSTTKLAQVPHHQLLPPLMERLAALGIPDSAITFYVAVGTHPPMTADEFPAILPAEILERFRVISHDSENDELLINLGETSRGTPVWANRAYVESDFKIVIGNIEPHQFAGFSGGVKSAAIGLAGLKTINRNHALMTHPDSQLGDIRDQSGPPGYRGNRGKDRCSHGAECHPEPAAQNCHCAGGRSTPGSSAGIGTFRVAPARCVSPTLTDWSSHLRADIPKTSTCTSLKRDWRTRRSLHAQAERSFW